MSNPRSVFGHCLQAFANRYSHCMDLVFTFANVFVCHMLNFSKLIFSRNSFRNIIRVSNSLDPDQARLLVGPGLDPNCLQRLSIDVASGQGV